MDITTMGERIRELRRNAGMTQDELGNKIGVSAQAVSNWERGSVPDTELIPRIADCFGVSTDALFGREYENYDVYSLMAKHIVGDIEKDGNRGEAIDRAFETCGMALAGTIFLKDGAGNNFFEKWLHPDTPFMQEFMAHPNKHSLSDNDDLTALMDRTEEMPFFLYMPEGTGRGKKLLENTDYGELFSAFADPDFFNAAVWVQGHQVSKNEKEPWEARFTKKTFIEKIGIPEERADELLDMLGRFGLIRVGTLELDDAEIPIYHTRWNPYFLMLLQVAYYCLHCPNSFYGNSNGRYNPPLKLD
jgi:transcriptional regulator with XRE-family HTH domain